MDNHCISKIREIFRVITAFECGLQEQIGLNINEAMLLCLLSESENPMLAGEIAEEMGLTRSNTSKVIRFIGAGFAYSPTCLFGGWTLPKVSHYKTWFREVRPFAL